MDDLQAIMLVDKSASAAANTLMFVFLEVDLKSMICNICE